jgi:hypothetical protein
MSNTSIKALKKMSRSNPQASDIRKIEDEIFLAGSDRVTAVMLSSFLEENLSRLIEKAMNPKLNSDDKTRIFGERGIAGTFSSKITTAWAFSLIGPIIRSDLDIIREIRNAAAHSRMHFSFNTEEVANTCRGLQIVNLEYNHIPFNYTERLDESEREKAASLDYPKTRFVTACNLISYRLFQKSNGPQEGDIAFNELLP